MRRGGALVAPRTLLLELGTRDEIFETEPSRRELRRLEAFFDRAGCPEKLAMDFFDGVHEFNRDDRLRDRFMDAL